MLLLTELTVSCRFVIHDFSARKLCITQCLNPPLLQEPAEGTRQQRRALSVPSTLQLLPVTSPGPPVPAQEGFTELLDPGHRGCLRTVRAAGGRGDVPPPPAQRCQPTQPAAPGEAVPSAPRRLSRLSRDAGEKAVLILFFIREQGS